MSFSFPYRIEAFAPPVDTEIMHGYDFHATLSPPFAEACLNLKLTSDQQRNLDRQGASILDRIALNDMKRYPPKGDLDRRINKETKKRIAEGIYTHPTYQFYKDTALIVLAQCNGHATLGCDHAEIHEAPKKGLVFRGHNIECADWQYQLACVWLDWANKVSDFLDSSAQKRK